MVHPTPRVPPVPDGVANLDPSHRYRSHLFAGNHRTGPGAYQSCSVWWGKFYTLTAMGVWCLATDDFLEERCGV